MIYRDARRTLNKLNEILSDIEQKQRQRKGAIEFNHTTKLGNEFDLKKLNEELQELELEFNRTKREL